MRRLNTSKQDIRCFIASLCRHPSPKSALDSVGHAVVDEALAGTTGRESGGERGGGGRGGMREA